MESWRISTEIAGETKGETTDELNIFIIYLLMDTLIND